MRFRRAVVAALAALGLVFLPVPAQAASSTLCTVTDPRLSSISGMAQSRGSLYVINDTAPVIVYRLDAGCHVAEWRELPIPAARDPLARVRATGHKSVDLEDLAADADGALWLGDIGGNTAPRSAVSLYRWVPGTTLDSARAGQVLTYTEAKVQRTQPNPVTRYDLRYPDGPHDAEALMVSLTGQVVLVTRVESGVAGIYAADLPLPAAGALRRVGSLDLRPWLPGLPLAAQAVTGGAVAPDGVHFALRTHGYALEWEAPDGDLVDALRNGVPREVALGEEAQGEAVTYAAGSPALLTEGEQLPAPLGSVALPRRPAYAPAAGPAVPVAVLLGAGAAGVLCLVIGVLAWRRHRPQAGGPGSSTPGSSLGGPA